MSYKPNLNLERNIKKKLIKGLDKASVVLQDEIKDNLSGPKTSKKLGVGTGKLKRSIQIDRSDINDLSVGVGTNVSYAGIHEFGGVIKVKTAEKLKFKIGNYWRTAKSVIIPARPFFRPSIKTAKKKMLKQFRGII
ncbi:MAG: HK97 gp10 family phage protein [Halanaerobiales bacterium]|nr:HK97 gp10 family phage protein [Halanaerobiales bacterium]